MFNDIIIVINILINNNNVEYYNNVKSWYVYNYDHN